MPRKPKVGLDYFPLDVDFESDPKIRKLSMSFGSEAILIYIEFLCIIYKAGYYVESDLDMLAEDIWYRLNFKVAKLELDTVKGILELMVDMNMIDIFNLHHNNVITSKAIQKQFYAITFRRKKVDRPYWLLTESDEEAINIYAGKNTINVDKNDDEINVDINGITADINTIDDDNNSVSADKGTQSKSKRKRKEDREDKYDKRNVPFHLHYYTQCLIHDHIINVYDLNLFKYNELFEEAASIYDFELVQRVFRYTRDDVRKHKSDIYDIYDFFKKAFNKNLEVMEHYDERIANWPQMFEEMMREFEKKKMIKSDEEDDE